MNTHNVIHAIRLVAAFARGRIDRHGNPLPVKHDPKHADRAFRGIIESDD